MLTKRANFIPSFRPMVQETSRSQEPPSPQSNTSVTALTPATQMFGQGNQLNTVGQPESVTAQQNIVVQAIVSESDITNTQNKIDKIKKGSEL
jgi:hypothetical protein